MGNVRKNNEDNLYCNGVSMTPSSRDRPFGVNGETRSPCLFAVCDGMGGQKDGETASLTAVSQLSRYSRAILAAPPKDVNAVVGEYVSCVNASLCEMTRGKSGGMGTTLALAVVTKNAIRAYTIGDSRIYIQKSGQFLQISKDHTVAEQKVALGILTREEARKHSDSHSLTNYLGLLDDEAIAQADIIPVIPVSTRFRLLICSDGLTDMVDDSQINEILLVSRNIAKAGKMLVKAALANGGGDNVTCVILDIAADK
jgi:protein phosphatase